MASPATPMCLRSREGRLWGHLSLDHVREQGVATLHVDHSQNLLHREKHRVRHSFHCCHAVCFKASSLPDTFSGSEDRSLHFTPCNSAFYSLNLDTTGIATFLSQLSILITLSLIYLNYYFILCALLMN